MAVANRKDWEHELLLLLINGDENEDIILTYLMDSPAYFGVPSSLRFRVSLDSFTNDRPGAETIYSYEKREKKDHIRLLYRYLNIPGHYTGYNRSVADGVEALLLLLRRLVYPNRLADLSQIFGRHKAEMSIIFNQILDDIHDRFYFLLSDMNLVWLNAEHFADAIYMRGAALSNCFGFVDGTVRPCARPKHNQRLVYSGHKRVHCLKFQSVETPNGMIASCYGPVEGRRHDAYILGESGLLQKLQEFNRANGEPLCLYGDPAYPLRAHLQSPFRGGNLSPEQLAFNKSMSEARVCVEWGFAKIVNLFAYLDFRKNLKLLLQPIGKLYIVGALLSNCHTCLYSCQTAKFFDLEPPTLQSYLTNQRF